MRPQGGLRRQKGVLRACVVSLALTIAFLPGCRRPVSAPAAAPAGQGRLWLIFVDDLHIAFRNTGHLRNLVRSLTSGLIEPNDTFRLSAIGPSSIDGLSDRSALDETIARLSGSGLKRTEIEAVPESSSEIQYRFRIAIEAADRMVADAAKHPATRRVMLYISDGYDVPGADQRLAVFSRAARRARVAVFTLNTRVFPASDRFDAPGREKAYTAATERSLRRLADPTGGAALLRAEDLASAVARIRDTARIRAPAP